MTDATFTLGIPTFDFPTHHWLDWQTDIAWQLPSDLSADNSPVTVLQFAVRTRSIEIYTTGDRDLNSDFEAYATAVTLSAGGSTFTFPGPAATDNALADDSSPYNYRLDSTGESTLSAFFTLWSGLTNDQKRAATVTFDDGVIPRPDVTAPTVTIADIADGNEGTTFTPSATVTGGLYDTIAYAWSSTAGSVFSAANILAPTVTRPQVAANTDFTITLSVTVAGNGTTYNSDSEEVVSAEATFTSVHVPPAALSDPTVTIVQVPNGDEGTPVVLQATVVGGNYDTIAYAWTVGDGTLNDATSATPVWTRPLVAADARVNIDLAVTVTGTDNMAATGTSTINAARRRPRVLDLQSRLPSAVAPTITIPPVPDGQGGTTFVLSEGVAGGVYDTITYAWTVSHGTLDDDTLASPTWTRHSPDEVEEVTISLTVSVAGGDTLARMGTSDSSTASVTATVNPLPPGALPTDLVQVTPWATNGERAVAAAYNLPTSTGWDPRYEQRGSLRYPERQLFNQLLYELSTMVRSRLSAGIMQWDARVDYLHPAFVTGSDGRIYRSIRDTGPAHSNAYDPTGNSGGLAWRRY